MFYPESDTILKSNASLSSEIKAVDTYLAALDPSEANRVDPTFMRSRLKQPQPVFDVVMQLYADSKVLTIQHWHFCDNCHSYIKPVALSSEPIWCADCELDLDDSQIKMTYKLVQPYYKPDSVKQQDYRPDPKVLIQKFERYTNSISSTSNDEKKVALEDLGAYIIGAVKGLVIAGMDQRGASSEIDLFFSNSQLAENSFVKDLGNPVIGEARNKNEAVSAKEIRDFVPKMTKANAQFGIIFSRSGFTGFHLQALSEAKLEIRDAFKAGRFILPIDHQDLIEISQGKNFVEILQQKYMLVAGW